MTDQDTNDDIERVLAALEDHAEALIKHAGEKVSDITYLVDVGPGVSLSLEVKTWKAEIKWVLVIGEGRPSIESTHFFGTTPYVESSARAGWEDMKALVLHHLEGARALTNIVR